MNLTEAVEQMERVRSYPGLLAEVYVRSHDGETFAVGVANQIIDSKDDVSAFLKSGIEYYQQDTS